MLCLCILPLLVTGSGCLSQTVSGSSPSSTLVVRSGGVLAPSVAVTKAGGWNSVAGATWVWETNSDSLGPFTFTTSFQLASWAKNKIASAYLYASVDNHYEIILNGHTVAPAWSGEYYLVEKFDIASLILGSDEVAVRENALVIKAMNEDGPAGLIYRIEINYS